MFTTFVNTILFYFSNLGYTGIIVLMAIESSFVPFPSEVVIPPAAYQAQQGNLNFFLVVICGIAGSLIGALINYFLAKWLGRVLIYRLARTRLAKLFLINEKKIAQSEDYFNRYGKASTFFGRLLPAVRQLISIPAGLARMDLGSFVVYTALGAGLWVTVLAIIGYAFGANKQLLQENYHLISKIFVVLAVSALLLVYLRSRRKKKS